MRNEEELKDIIQSIASRSSDKKSMWELASGLSALEELEATPKEISIYLGFFFGGRVPEDSPLVTDIVKWKDKLLDWEFDPIELDSDAQIFIDMIKSYSGDIEKNNFLEEFDHALKISEFQTYTTILDKYLIVESGRDVVRFEFKNSIYTAIILGSKYVVFNEKEQDVTDQFGGKYGQQFIMTLPRMGGREALTTDTARKRLPPHIFSVAIGEYGITPLDLPSDDEDF